MVLDKILDTTLRNFISFLLLLLLLSFGWILRNWNLLSFGGRLPLVSLQRERKESGTVRPKGRRSEKGRGNFHHKDQPDRQTGTGTPLGPYHYTRWNVIGTREWSRVQSPLLDWCGPPLLRLKGPDAGYIGEVLDVFRTRRTNGHSPRESGTSNSLLSFEIHNRGNMWDERDEGREVGPKYSHVWGTRDRFDHDTHYKGYVESLRSTEWDSISKTRVLSHPYFVPKVTINLDS